MSAVISVCWLQGKIIQVLESYAFVWLLFDLMSIDSHEKQMEINNVIMKLFMIPNWPLKKCRNFLIFLIFMFLLMQYIFDILTKGENANGPNDMNNELNFWFSCINHCFVRLVFINQFLQRTINIRGWDFEQGKVKLLTYFPVCKVFISWASKLTYLVSSCLCWELRSIMPKHPNILSLILFGNGSNYFSPVWKSNYR